VGFAYAGLRFVIEAIYMWLGKSSFRTSIVIIAKLWLIIVNLNRIYTAHPALVFGKLRLDRQLHVVQTPNNVQHATPLALTSHTSGGVEKKSGELTRIFTGLYLATFEGTSYINEHKSTQRMGCGWSKNGGNVKRRGIKYYGLSV
jgi:hypothetical protein